MVDIVGSVGSDYEALDVMERLYGINLRSDLGNLVQVKLSLLSEAESG